MFLFVRVPETAPLSVNDDLFLRCELLTSYVVSSYADILATWMSGPRWSYSGSETDHSYDACNHMTPDTIHVHSGCYVVIQTVTGEEDEEAIFSDRCKLFRMVDSEWKERGLGTMKILRHKTDQSYRLVMRREQVHKLCANHKLNSTMKLLTVSCDVMNGYYT